MFKKVIITVAVEIVLFLLLFLLIICYPWQDSTLYPPTYSESGFRSVRPGYTMEQVERLTGPPLDIHTDSDKVVPSGEHEAHRGGPSPSGKTWSYTMPDREMGSCAYYVRELQFDRHGRVVGKDVGFQWD